VADDSAPAPDVTPPASTTPGLGDVIAGALPGILDRARVVVSPYPFGISDGDSLRITTVCSQPGVVLEIHTRRFYKQTGVTIDRLVHAPNSDRTVKTDDYPLAAGFVTNVTVFAASGSPLIGQCYVKLQLLRGIGAGAFVMGTLLGNVVTQTHAAGWPGSPIVSPLEVEPYVRFIVGTKPGAGAEITEMCPTNARWELMQLTSVITASGAVANRSLDLQAPGGQFQPRLFLSNVVATAGQAWRVQWAPNIPNIVNAGFTRATGAFAERCLLTGGKAFSTLTTGLDVGDQYEAPEYIVREWLELV
jgi:hypothetical protein